MKNNILDVLSVIQPEQKSYNSPRISILRGGEGTWVYRKLLRLWRVNPLCIFAAVLHARQRRSNDRKRDGGVSHIVEYKRVNAAVCVCV